MEKDIVVKLDSNLRHRLLNVRAKVAHDGTVRDVWGEPTVSTVIRLAIHSAIRKIRQGHLPDPRLKGHVEMKAGKWQTTIRCPESLVEDIDTIEYGDVFPSKGRAAKVRLLTFYGLIVLNTEYGHNGRMFTFGQW